MAASPARPFDALPRTPRNHFRLNLYAAVYTVVDQVRRFTGRDDLGRASGPLEFLRSYFEELRPHLPPSLTWEAGLPWFEARLAEWESTAEGHLPLRALRDELGIGFPGRVALLAAGLIEEDSRFGLLFARLQEPLQAHRPTQETLARLLKGADAAAGREVCRPLFAAGLLEAVPPATEAPRAEWVVRVPAAVWSALRGESDPQPAPWARYHDPSSFPGIDDLDFPAEFLERLRRVGPLAGAGRIRGVVLRGMLGSERLEVIGAIARGLGRGVLEVETGTSERSLETVGALAALTRSVPVLVCDPGPGETVDMPADLATYAGLTGILMGFDGGVRGPGMDRAVTLNLPLPDAALRARRWRKVLGSNPADDVDELADRFHLPGGTIRKVASLAVSQAALRGRERVGMEDVREACRVLHRETLDTLATFLETSGRWEDLIVSAGPRERLRELEQRCRHRERLTDNLSPAFGSGPNRGVRALFTGPSGTGKTLAARILAERLGLDLYAANLAAILNRFVGETEKSLNRLLGRAEELDVVLLLDEGDALLGRRTEVRSANDRYANTETDFLLQRLEAYQGILLVTTNAGDNIDPAFQRRMDVVVSFIAPQPEERRAIWNLHLPADHAVESSFIEEASVRCAMTGGQIRSATLHAKLLALEEGIAAPGRAHVEAAIRGEYRKAGAMCPLHEGAFGKEPEGGTEAFLNALSNSP